MSVAAVLLPVFVLIALTFILHYWMGVTRVSSVQRGEVHVREPVGGVGACHRVIPSQIASSREITRALIGSFWIALSSADRASSGLG